MAAPVTEEFEQMVLEISDDGATWSRICGMVGVTVNRSAQVDSSEVPADCDDESKPMEVKKAVRSLDVSASGEGVWAQQSHQTMIDWFYGAAAKHVRLGNLNAAVGDTEYEQGKAILNSLTNQRTKGQQVSASIGLEFDGVPTRTVKAA